jgi:hypothetical protein
VQLFQQLKGLARSYVMLLWYRSDFFHYLAVPAFVQSSVNDKQLHLLLRKFDILKKNVEPGSSQ